FNTASIYRKVNPLKILQHSFAFYLLVKFQNSQRVLSTANNQCSFGLMERMLLKGTPFLFTNPDERWNCLC
ncbi:MAG: hypothetical protein ACUVT3_09605, partial [Ignavibacterium sp.]